MTALFTGTFNPFTRGHASIVARALAFCDHIIIGVAESRAKGAAPPAESRAEAIRRLYKDEPRVSAEPYHDLTIDLAQRTGADVLLRGVRSVKDYEYERQQADFNRAEGGIETILLMAEPGLDIVSSSLVRELQSFGRDASKYLP